MRIGRTAVLHFITQVGTTIAGFIATFVIARLLGAEALGTYGVILALLFWSRLPVGAIGTSINKRVSEGENKGSYFTAGFILMLCVVGLATVLVTVFENAVDSYIGADLAHVFIFLFAADAIFKMSDYGLRGQKRVAHSGLTLTVERVLRTSFQIGFILAGWKVLGLVIGHSLSLFTSAIIGFLLFRIRPSVPGKEEFVSLFKYARYSWLGNLQTVSFGWMDTSILAFFTTNSLIGIYEASWAIGSAIVLLGFSIRKTLFPEISDLETQDNYDEIRNLINEGLTYAGLLSIPGVFGAAVLGPRILKIYRPEFSKGGVILVILVTAQLIAAYGKQFISVINGIDKPEITFRINFVFVVSNVTMNFILIYLFGWYGAAIATTISAIISLVMGYRYASELLGGIDLPIFEILKQIVASAVMAGVVLSLRFFAPVGNYVTVALVGVGVAVYGVVILAVSARVRKKVLDVSPFDL